MATHSEDSRSHSIWHDHSWGMLQVLVPPSLLGLTIWWSANVGYLFAHTLAELFSIVVAATAMAVATTSRYFTRNQFIVFVSVAIGWCAGLDLIHTMVFKGMHLVGSDSANPPTQLWIAARFIQAVAMVVAPFMLRRTVRVGWLHLMFGAISAAALLGIAFGYFPDAFVDGSGLTEFKIRVEYLIIVLLGVALALLWQRRQWNSPRLLWAMSASLGVMMASEFAFTQYATVYAESNLIGHILKVYAYWFVYVALVETTLREPFELLSRAASTYDAIPEPTFVVAANGVIHQANRAAFDRFARHSHALVGQGIHDLLHDIRIPIQQCPVCQQLGRPGSGFLTELVLPGERFVEFHVAPFTQSAEATPTWVMVVRDVSERERSNREREQLLLTLQERVKELRCLDEVSRLCQHAGPGIADLLARLVEVIPPGFMVPQRLKVGIDSIWGRYGERLPDPAPVELLQVDLQHEGGAAGHLSVWYGQDDTLARVGFLPEEHALLDNIARQVNEAQKRLHAQERVKRLSYLYEMLSATNRAVARCRDQEALFNALQVALLAQGAFPKLFIALTDDGQMPMRLHFHHGIAVDMVPALTAVISRPDSRLAVAMSSFKQGRVLCQSLPERVEHDRDRLPAQLQAWESYLEAEGIRHRAVMPLIAEGHLLGIVGLYVGGMTGFDDEQIQLLDDMAADVTFALERFASDHKRHLAETLSREMESRFKEVFLRSPVPMQIESLSTRQMRVLNAAHHRWLGYTIDDIKDEAAWFRKAYPNEQERASLMQSWETSLAQARRGESVHSPELRLRGKDGRDRFAQGTVSIVEDDIIIAWTDLTEVRRAEHSLRESEQRFRGMVEQTISGMYVRRDGKFLYVNPRFCEILGWSSEELVGKEVLQFTDPDPANIERIRRAWIELHAGSEQSVSYSVPIRRRDGQMIEMGLHAKLITWDDGLPATIVMAQDITARKRAEDKIAAHVSQLEASMRGTLQAVASMVEMRDPYTAGHERRVGLIASALAREMGWDEARCKNMEQLGLVHDIGKIAVPSEILTRPTRLSHLEMEMMKAHAQAGYEILKDVPFPTPVAEIIRQHHERMDGSGYPRGLKGDQIMPEARVLAVADVIESMASHRPYRPAVGVDAALAEIVRGRGQHYDAEVCDAAIRLVQEKGYSLPT